MGASLTAESYGGVSTSQALNVSVWSPASASISSAPAPASSLDAVSQNLVDQTPVSRNPKESPVDQELRSHESAEPAETASTGDFPLKFGLIIRTEREVRSLESMQLAIEQMAELGRLSDFDLYTCAMHALVDKNRAIQNDSPVDELKAGRTYIAAMTGLGIAWLDGTTNDASALPRSMDMGGKASMALAYSKAMIESSITVATRLVGSVIDGKIVDAGEVYDLSRVSAFVDQLFAQIDGPHDLRRAKTNLMNLLMPHGNVTELNLFESPFSQYLSAEREQKFIRDFYVDTGHKIVSFINEAASKGVSIAADPFRKKVVAKLLRDQALAMVAHIEVKLRQRDVSGAHNLIFGTPEGRMRFVSGTNTSRGYDGLIEALKLSESLVPEHPDLAVLNEMLLSMRDRVSAKVA